MPVCVCVSVYIHMPSINDQAAGSIAILTIILTGIWHNSLSVSGSAVCFYYFCSFNCTLATHWDNLSGTPCFSSSTAKGSLQQELTSWTPSAPATLTSHCCSVLGNFPWLQEQAKLGWSCPKKTKQLFFSEGWSLSQNVKLHNSATLYWGVGGGE